MKQPAEDLSGEKKMSAKLGYVGHIYALQHWK